jgi:hypothetical protein
MAVLNGSVSSGNWSAARGWPTAVYEVHGGLVQRIVAIKVLAPPFDRVRRFVEWFRPAASAAAHLN